MIRLPRVPAFRSLPVLVLAISLGAGVAHAAVPPAGVVTTHDAVSTLADQLHFEVIGLDRLGNEAAHRPGAAADPQTTLKSLLRDYSYIVELRPAVKGEAIRLPARIRIMGPGTGTPASDEAAPNQVASQPSPLAIAAQTLPTPPSQSASSRTSATGSSPLSSALHTLAASMLPGTAQRAGLTPANTAGSASGDTPDPAHRASDLAALTRTAQANLGALVAGLNQVCGKSSGC